MRPAALAWLPILVACRGDLPTSKTHPLEATCGDVDTSPPPDTATDDSGGGDTDPGETGDTGGVPSTLALSAPTDGARWAVGASHTVTWTWATPDDPVAWPVVAVEWSADGETWTPALATDGQSGAAIYAPYDEEQSFAWEVPEDGLGAVTLRVRDYDDERVGDEVSLEIIASQAKSYAWEEITGAAAFAARDGAGALVFGGKMWLLGGWNPSDRVNFPNICNSEVWSSTDGATWTEEVPEAPWEGRHTAGYAVLGDEMWILGGDPIQGHYQPDAWSSEDGVTWTERVTELPWGYRVLHHTAVLDGTIYVMGGQTLPHFAPEIPESIFYNDVWASADGETWTRLLEEAPWAPRGMIGGSAVLDGKIWLLGGGTYDTPDHPDRDYYNDVWSSPDGVNWTQHLAHAPWAARQYHDVAVFDDRLWVMEGYAGGNRTDVWYSADGENWYEVPDTPWAARHAASVFVHDDALWMVAGNNMTPDVWRLSAAE